MALIREKRIEEILEGPARSVVDSSGGVNGGLSMLANSDSDNSGGGGGGLIYRRPTRPERHGKFFGSDRVVGVDKGRKDIGSGSDSPVTMSGSKASLQTHTEDHVEILDDDDDDDLVSERNSQGEVEISGSSSNILLDEPSRISDLEQAAEVDAESEHSSQLNHRKATGMSVRCHCNLASCVTNNYMCKSERRVTEDGKTIEAGCFVQELETESVHSHGGSSSMSSSGLLTWNGRIPTARRGCVEMLSREKQEQCSEGPGNQVLCCTEDMCNYPKSFYPIQSLNSNARGSFDPSSGLTRTGIAMTPNLDHQVWLRAAVIAVPICGLMILVVLIVVARRLLRSDEEYKGRRCRRKFSTHAEQAAAAAGIPHHHHHHYQPSSYPVHLGGGGGGGGRSGTFGSEGNFGKPGSYLEPSNSGLESLLPCQCHQPQIVRMATTNQSHESGRKTNSSSSSSSSNNNSNCNNNNNRGNSSETEELVRSWCGGKNNCRCREECGSCGGGNLDEDSESQSGSLSWSSQRPLSAMSGSSPELPAVHREDVGRGSSGGKSANHLLLTTKTGLSRPGGTQTDAHSECSSSRTFNVV